MPTETASSPRPSRRRFAEALRDVSVRSPPFFSSAQSVVIGNQLPKIVFLPPAKAFPGDISDIFRNRLPGVLTGDLDSRGEGICEMREAGSRDGVSRGEVRQPSGDGDDVSWFDHVPTSRHGGQESGGKEFFPLGIQYRVKWTSCLWYLAGQHFEGVDTKDFGTDGVGPGFCHGHPNSQAGK